jgi:hypothetical protein
MTPPPAARLAALLAEAAGDLDHCGEVVGEAAAGLGFGRIVASEIEAPNMLVHLV